jgi:hypothetical protein
MTFTPDAATLGPSANEEKEKGLSPKVRSRTVRGLHVVEEVVTPRLLLIDEQTLPVKLGDVLRCPLLPTQIVNKNTRQKSISSCLQPIS